MRKVYTVFGLLLLVVLLSSLQAKNDSDNSWGSEGPRKSAGPPTCSAGEPTFNLTCAQAGCHQDFTLNSGPALLNLYLGDSAGIYKPGQTYSIRVSLKRTGLVMGGFQLTALWNNDANTTPGIFTLTDATRTQKVDASNSHGCAPYYKTWIEHTAGGIEQVSGDSITWQFNWQAPFLQGGPITFYVATTDCNRDLDNTGDHVYALSRTINAPNNPTGINLPIGYDDIKFYPNPVTDALYFTLPANQQGAIKVFDVTGKLVLIQNASPSLMQQVSLAGLPAGVYMVSYQSSTLSFGKRVIKE